MRVRKIAHMSIVAHRRAVGCRIVGTVNIDLRALTERGE